MAAIDVVLALCRCTDRGWCSTTDVARDGWAPGRTSHGRARRALAIPRHCVGGVSTRKHISTPAAIAERRVRDRGSCALRWHR